MTDGVLHETGGADLPSAEPPRTQPWVETPEGGLFFVNALLVAPAFVVLFPLSLQVIVGMLAPERPPSPYLDTIPFVAARAIPFLGWFLVIPVWTTIKNLRMRPGRVPGAALLLFLMIHLSFLGYTVWSWIGG